MFKPSHFNSKVLFIKNVAMEHHAVLIYSDVKAARIDLGSPLWTSYVKSTQTVQPLKSWSLNISILKLEYISLHNTTSYRIN